uniref:Fibronectin type-III domain-containing protein n=1 Tax=Syphacia muris TaxID=451379 RepID=A0A0N5AA06_9BILA
MNLIDIRLLNLESYDFRIVVMALNAGRLPFPKLQLQSSTIDSAILEEIVWLSVPSSIFVLTH